MVETLFYQMCVKLRAEKAGLASIGMETGQIVLRYPSIANDKESRRLHDLGPEVRGGKGAYWCMFGKDENWRERLLETLELVRKQN